MTKLIPATQWGTAKVKGYWMLWKEVSTSFGIQPAFSSKNERIRLCKVARRSKTTYISEKHNRIQDYKVWLLPPSVDMSWFPKWDDTLGYKPIDVDEAKELFEKNGIEL